MQSACPTTPPQAAGLPPTQPQLSVLHQLFEENHEQLVDDYLRRGRPLPNFILKSIQKFRECGDPRFGFVAIDCGNCGVLESVPLSCKQRAWCPRCLVRRMIDRGTSISERIIGDKPVRHYVLTFPLPLSRALAYNHELLGKLVNAVVNAILAFIRRKARKNFGLSRDKDAHPGAISSIHRCSSNLDLNVHIHILATDGVFVRDQPGGSVSFRDLPAPTKDEIAAIAWKICRRSTDILRASGLWRDINVDSGASPTEPKASSSTQARQIRGVLSLGPKYGEREVTYFGRASESTQNDQRGSSFDLYAKRGIAQGDHKGLKKLVQYLFHPPLTDRQLSLTPDGRVMLKPDRPWQHNTKPIVFDKMELLKKLIPLVPYPGSKTIRFHGVFAPNATLRAEARPKVPEPQSPIASSDSSHQGRHMPWVDIIKHRTGVDLRRCPHCSAPTRLTINFPNRSNRKIVVSDYGFPGDSHDPPTPPTPGKHEWIH